MLKTKPFKIDMALTSSLSREQTWLVVSDVTSVKRNAQFPVVEFAKQRDDETGFLGAKIEGRWGSSWQELPCEWVDQSQWSIVQEFSRGLLSKVWQGLSLDAASDDQVEVHLFFYGMPRYALLAPLAKLTAKLQLFKTRRSMQAMLKHRKNPLPVAMKAKKQTPVSHFKLLQLTRQLRARSPINHAYVNLLTTHLRQAPDDQLVSMCPYRLADFWGQSRRDILQTFLHATAHGLLGLEWTLQCPSCYSTGESFRTLADVETSGSCHHCRHEYDSDVSSSVCARFFPASEVRDVSAPTYASTGPAEMPQVLAYQLLPAGEQRLLKLELSAGTYALKLQNQKDPLRFTVTDSATTSELSVNADRKGWGGCGDVKVKPGMVELNVTSTFDSVTWFTLTDATFEPTRVTAVRVILHPEFRRFFPDQVLGPGRFLFAADTVFMATRVSLASSGNKELEDSDVYQLLHRCGQFQRRLIQNQSGQLLVTKGRSMLWVFPKVQDAVYASLEVQRNLRDFNQEHSSGEPLEVQAAVKSGAALLVTENGHLDFFGRTLETLEKELAATPAGLVMVAQEDHHSLSEFFTQYQRTMSTAVVAAPVADSHYHLCLEAASESDAARVA